MKENGALWFMLILLSLYQVFVVHGRSVVEVESVATNIFFNETSDLAEFNATAFILNYFSNSSDTNNTDGGRRQQKQQEGEDGATAAGAGGVGAVPSIIESILQIPVARETVVAILKAISSPFDYITNALRPEATEEPVTVAATEPTVRTTTGRQFILVQIPG